MTQSKTNPDSKEVVDYTWLTRDSYTIKAGQLPDGQDVCYIQDLAQVLTEHEATMLATDLLRWAQFIAEGEDATIKDEAELMSLIRRQAD